MNLDFGMKDGYGLKIKVGMANGGGATLVTENLLLRLQPDAGTYQDAGTTPATSDTDVIGQWQDQSGNNVHYSQVTPGLKPILKLNQKNGLPAIRFDGIDDFLSTVLLTSSALSYTFYIVVNPTPTAGRQLFDVQTGRLALSTNSFTGGKIAYYDATEKLSSSVTENVWQIDTWTFFADGNGNMYKNGVLIGTAAYSKKSLGVKSTIGASYTGQYPTGADIGDILLYSGCHDYATRKSVEEYLSFRWGITVTETPPDLPNLALSIGYPVEFTVRQR